ncbi:hypothetical protein PG988_002115 [Apiospora saccharicola]
MLPAPTPSFLLASEVTVDLAVAGVAGVVGPVAELAAAVVGAPVAAKVPEAEAAVAVGDDDEAGGEQAAAEPVQGVPVGDADAGLVAQDAALAVGHVELELEPVRVAVRLVVVPLRELDAALVVIAAATGFDDSVNGVAALLGRGALEDGLLVARVVHVEADDLVGGRGQVGPLVVVPDGVGGPVVALALGQQDVNGARAPLGEDARGHGEELLGALLAAHLLLGRLVPVVGPAVLEEQVAREVVPGVADLLHLGLGAHLGVEEARVALDVVGEHAVSAPGREPPGLPPGRAGDALGRALELSRYDMADELFKRGATWNYATMGDVLAGAREDNDWNTKAIDVAVANGWNINEHYEHVGCALVISHVGDTVCLKLADHLLSKGAHPDEGMQTSQNPLELACGAPDRDMVALLLARGSTLDRAPKALLAAARRGSIEVMQMLLDRGADVNTHPYGKHTLNMYVKSEGWGSALHCAVKGATSRRSSSCWTRAPTESTGTRSG